MNKNKKGNKMKKNERYFEHGMEVYVCIKCKTTYDKPIQQNHGHPKGVCINCAIDDYNQSTLDFLGFRKHNM